MYCRLNSIYICYCQPGSYTEQPKLPIAHGIVFNNNMTISEKGLQEKGTSLPQHAQKGKTRKLQMITKPVRLIAS